MFTMNVFNYTKRIGKSIASGDMTGAIHLFRGMKEVGMKPDVVTYNVMMDGFSKTKDAESVRQLFDEMLHAGIQPNNYVFNTAIRACAINVNLKRAGELYGLMHKMFGLEPNTKTYGALIHVCAVAGRLSLAKKCYTRMQREGVGGHIVICNSLIDAYAEATDRKNGLRHLQECRYLMEDIEERGYRPDDHTLGVLMKLCARGGLLREGLDIIPEMERKGVHPNVVAYGTLLDGLAKDTTVSKGQVAFMLNEILDEMEKREMRPDVHMYNTLLNLCFKIEDLKLANGFFKQLKESNLKPDAICYGTMMKCYEKLGDPARKDYLQFCFELVVEMKAAGLKIDHEVYVTQISVCANARDVESAMVVWKHALENGIAADVVLYGAIIKACLRGNDRQQAEAFLTQMEADGIVRSLAICDMFLRYYLQMEMYGSAKEFLSEMRKKGIRLESSIEKEVENI